MRSGAALWDKNHGEASVAVHQNRVVPNTFHEGQGGSARLFIQLRDELSCIIKFLFAGRTIQAIWILSVGLHTTPQTMIPPLEFAKPEAGDCR